MTEHQLATASMLALGIAAFVALALRGLERLNNFLKGPDARTR